MKRNRPASIICLALLLLIYSCNHIKSGDKLSSSERSTIDRLYKLDAREKVDKFYSEHTSDVAGNFFTNKRIANYWLDKNDKARTAVNFAWYSDIMSIDTVFNAGATYCPYMLITRKDSSQFKVFADGDKADVNAFFTGAMNNWKRSGK